MNCIYTYIYICVCVCRYILFSSTACRLFFPQYSPLTQFVSGRKHQSVSLGWILGDNLSQVKCDKHLQGCAPKIAKLVCKSNNSG